jgi:hypothetical protein
MAKAVVKIARLVITHMMIIQPVMLAHMGNI